MLRVVKKCSAFMMVIALLVMNIASVSHAECPESDGYERVQAVTSAGDSGDMEKGTQSAVCDCCATCGHHHHVQAFLAHSKAAHRTEISTKQRRRDEGETYLSQLHYPPSKPPEA
jgi:hypothetical protein